jgi:hypothetical protein
MSHSGNNVQRSFSSPGYRPSHGGQHMNSRHRHCADDVQEPAVESGLVTGAYHQESSPGFSDPGGGTQTLP